MASLNKAKAIEKHQENKLKAAKAKAAKETRNALYAAFGKQGITNMVASPLRKELAAALAQEKAQSKQIQHLQSLESARFKAAGSEGAQCQVAGSAAHAYEVVKAVAAN